MEALATRMSRLGTESAFAVLARAGALEAQGRRVTHLEIGEPRFPTPANIVEAAERALADGHTGYVSSAGIPAAREAVARTFAATRGVAVDPARVVVTPGAKPILCFATLALVERGDEVVLPDPGFPIYRSMVEFAGGTARTYAAPDEIPALVGERTRLVILNSPANPTGAVLTRAELERVAEAVVRGERCLVLSDEVYRGLAYADEPPASIAQLDGMLDRAVVVDGLSKQYAMTGWRAGWGIVPPALAEGIERLVVNSVSCVPPFVQHALVEALTGDQSGAAAIRAGLRERRDALVPALAAVAGIECPLPAGAFYAWARVSGTGMDGDAFAERLLEEAGIAALAGSGFGAAGREHVRFSFGGPLEELAEVPSRIAAWLRAS